MKRILWNSGFFLTSIAILRASFCEVCTYYGGPEVQYCLSTPPLFSLDTPNPNVPSPQSVVFMILIKPNFVSRNAYVYETERDKTVAMFETG